MNKRPGEKGKSGAADESIADAEHFARAMADVVRLPLDPRGRVRPAPRIIPPRASTESRSSAGTPDVDGSDDSFVAPGVDPREVRKLKRGDYIPGSRLDLHGMRATEAVASVKRFIDTARRNRTQAGLEARAARCVCVVHGRGLHSEGNVSILRTHVRECLRRHPSVLAYADAPRSDGGPGAVYALLRK